MLPFLTGFSALSFFCYGTRCLLSASMMREFERFGVQRFRRLIGVTQLLAASGLLLSFIHPLCGLIAAGGLSLQMLLGFCLRLKIKDSLLQSSPAIFYCALNAYLGYRFWLLW
jgi:uncharacterized membrane protein YkgB